MTSSSEPVDHVTLLDLTKGLRALGVGPGFRVVVHSSLSSFGHVDGGAESVITALMSVIGPTGTLLMPSFNHGRPFEDGGPGVYDPRNTPTTNGIIPDTFWRRPDVHRSLNPTHPFAAWGQDASSYTESHHRTLTMGIDSPLGLLNQRGGYGLLLGVNYSSNTFHHVVETIVGSPCLGRRTEAYPVRVTEERVVVGRTWSWRDGCCPFSNELGYGPIMERVGLHSTVQIGQCRAVLFRLADCFTVVSQLLREGTDAAPPCTSCPIIPCVNKWTVESDWDDAAGTLLPGSEAGSY